MSEAREPTPGAGIRHAMALAVAAMLPLAYAAAASADAGIDGFPLWPSVAIILLTCVAAALVSVAFPVPSNWELAARAAIVALVALGVRFTVPSPGEALSQVRAGDAPVLSGTALLMLLMMALAYAVGHGFAAYVANLATPARTTQLQAARDRRTLVAWFWATAISAFVVGAMRSTAGTTGSVLLVVCALVGLALIADLRLRTAPPGATRPPLIAAPRQVRRAGVTFGLLAVGIAAALLTPLVPVDALRTLPSLPDWNWEFADREAASELIEAVTGDDVDEEVEPPPDVPEEMLWRGWDIPTPPWPVLALLGAALLLLLLRPQRWRAGLARLLAILRRARWLADDQTMGDLTELEEFDDEHDERRDPGRLRRALRRIRPRPRDPRAAVLHDYLHVERLLAKREQGRLGPETPHEHAVRVHVSAAHEELADLAADARFGRTAPSSQDVARARQLRRDVEVALRGHGE